MAPYDDGDINLSDDDALDDPHVWAKLENDAIQFTQKAVDAKAPPSSDYGDEDFDSDDLDDALVIDESKSGPACPAYQNKNNAGQASQKENFRQQRYGNGIPTLGSRQRPNVPPLPRQADRMPPPPIPPFTLTQKNRALEQEKNSKDGEVSILRTGMERLKKENERAQAAKDKFYTDQIAKLQKEREAALLAAKNAAVERDFTKRDLAEESERVRRLNKAKNAKEPPVTPKKKKALPVGDGFDDDEVEMVSPSKLSPSKFQRRLTASPLKARGKRKRKVHDSPAGALEVVTLEEDAPAVEVKAPVLEQPIIKSVPIQDDRFDFLGAMLDRRPNHDSMRTIQEFSKHALPSTPNESFESIILGKISSLGGKKVASDLPVDFCEVLIKLWTKCVEEEYYAPLYLIIDMLTFALELKTTLIAPQITDSLLPVLQKTVEIIAIPRFQRETIAIEKLAKYIDVTACMALLHLTALGCVPETEHIERFWKSIGRNFILVMLCHNHPMKDYEYILQILSTGILKGSFGSISKENTSNPDAHTAHILERVTRPIFDVRYLPVSNDKVDATALLKLRLQSVQLFIGMTRSPYAGKALATDRLVIGRLVSMISDEIDTLYDYKSDHQESALLINLSTRLLYHLIQTYEHLIDMTEKLSIIPGGQQKYRYLLSRLYCLEDDLVLESGIDHDIGGLAYELLNLRFTPEDGADMDAAFATS